MLPGSDYRAYLASIPETPLDRAVLALLDFLPPDHPTIAKFGPGLCPAGTALIEPLGCCWHFGSGPTKVIERMSLGTANAWRLDRICEPGDASPVAPGPISTTNANETVRPDFRPWDVRHPDVSMTVFPTGPDVILDINSKLIAIPAGTLVGRIGYSPGGQRAFDPRQLTYAVANVFRGFELIFDCMESCDPRQFSLPKYFLGDAPQARMCHFLTRFGFDVIDNGELGATVFAPVERVREHLDQHRPHWERIFERSDRISSQAS